jgi:hypothetical protein
MEGEFLMAKESIIITVPERSSLFVIPVKQFNFLDGERVRVLAWSAGF